MATGDRRVGGTPLSLNTLRLYRSALNDYWRQAGRKSPADDTGVDEILRGMNRLSSSIPRQVKALREHHILEMLNCCSTSLHGLRDAGVLALGFAAALRRSEICTLMIADIKWMGPSKMILYIRCSKTDKVGKGQQVAVVDGRAIRPISHVDTWLDRSGIRGGFLFQTLGRGGVPTGRPLDPGEIARTVKRYTQKIGLDPKDYSAHSLRAGFVTSAAVHHARLDKIMEITRHKSPATVLIYIRDAESFENHAGAAFL